MRDGTTGYSALPLTFLAPSSLQTGPGEVFAIETSPAPSDLGGQRYRFGVSSVTSGLWPSATALTRSIYTATFPSSFVARSDSSIGFNVYRAGGHTFAVPTFSKVTGYSKETTTVIVFDSASGTQLSISPSIPRVSIAIDSGDAWYTLDPSGYSLDHHASAILRRYTW